MVVFDSSVLLLAIDPGAPVPTAPDGSRIEHAHERVLGLLKELEAARTQVLLPTPVLAESFVKTPAADAQRLLDRLQKLAAIEIATFDAKAAFEVADMGRVAEKKAVASSADTWAKVKYDRQIVAIAKVRGARVVYCADAGLAAIAEKSQIRVVHLANLPLPPEIAQRELNLS